MKKIRYLTAALCAVFLLSGFMLPAYAFVDEAVETEETETVAEPVEDTEITEESAAEEPTPEPEPETVPAEEPTEDMEKVTGGMSWEELGIEKPLTPDGQGTMVDNATDEDGKEFFTITTADEAVFYLVVDRQKTGNNVYFLNAVTVDDLMSLAEPGKEKSTSITAPEPSPEPVPTSTPEPTPKEETTENGNAGMILLVVTVAAVGGMAGWYFKIYRPKQQQAAELEDYPDETVPAYDSEPGIGAYDSAAGDYGDTPPWDEEAEE